MANYGYTFTSGDTVTPTKLNNARTVSEIVNADVKSDAAIAGSKIDPQFNAPAVVAVNSASTALRVTQEGAGDALVVEDSTNPDSTPLVVNNLGQIVSGATTAFDSAAGLQITSDLSTAPNANITVRRCHDSINAAVALMRTRGTAASQAGVQSGDSLGVIQFFGYNATSASNVMGARILARNDASPGASNMPAALEIFTNGSERMRITSAGNVGIGTASPSATLSVSGDALVSANTSTDALRITQEGAGNALVVEDSTNPDSTPLVVNSVGQIISGATTAFASNAGLQLTADSSSAPNATISLRRCSDTTAVGLNLLRTRGTASAPTSVQSGDLIGLVTFGAYDGTATRFAASIGAKVDGTTGTNDVPTSIYFSTTPDGSSTDTERMLIKNDGRVGIGTSSPTTLLDVNGTVTATAFAGPVTGNVTGNLTGNVTGNLTGTASAIADGSVSTGKIVDANVTTAKLATATQQSLVPAGAVMPFAMNSAPSGWLAADGSAVSRTTYATLFAAISTTHGVGDGSTTFNLPDLRGIFVRGSGSQTISGITYNKTFANKEGDALQGHWHATQHTINASGSSGTGSLAAGSGWGTTSVRAATTDGVNGTPRTDSETRPANIALLYCIKT